MLPADRRSYILSLLAERGMVRIDELSRALGVSVMTVHRDLDRLAVEGRVQKVRGGAVLRTPAPSPGDECPVCHASPLTRTQMVLHLSDGSHERACCPHCGLLALAAAGSRAIAALVTDFLYGRMVNARVASYVVEPEVHLCCTPTVLAFEHSEDATRFQRGFGGQVLGMEEAIQHLQGVMRLQTG